jgi:tetratricopeptide (TPR) repeat protein
VSKNLLLVLTIVSALVVAVVLVRVIDARQTLGQKQFADESLYVNASTAKHLALAFNGLASDWYWMRSLQYVGGKIVAFEDTHNESFVLGDLDLHLLPSLLRLSTALDPQFIAPYEYGALVLPELNSDEAIALVNSGIASNPAAWRLYQHLGYIYWKRNDYEHASANYAAGAKLPGAPAWMAAMGARMQAEGGSRGAAREMYRHLYESSNDPAVKDMVEKQIMRIDSQDQRDAIRNVLSGYRTRNGRCASSWRDVANELRAAQLTLDPRTGAPLDPSSTPYELIKNGCDVGLDINTGVPFK